MMINSTPGSRLMSCASARPMIQLRRVSATRAAACAPPARRDRYRRWPRAAGCRDSEAAWMRFSIRKTVHWPTGPEVQQKPVPGGAMLYDASRAGNADAHWFDRDWWSRRGQVRAAEEGRGAAVFIHADGRRLVLRHYRRGGWMARALLRSLSLARRRLDALLSRVVSAVPDAPCRPAGAGADCGQLPTRRAGAATAPIW